MEVIRNGVYRFENPPKPAPKAKPEPVGDPRRSLYGGGGIQIGPDVDYTGEKKTVQEWLPLVASRIVKSSVKNLTGGPFTESEFFDLLDAQDSLELYC